MLLRLVVPGLLLEYYFLIVYILNRAANSWLCAVRRQMGGSLCMHMTSTLGCLDIIGNLILSLSEVIFFHDLNSVSPENGDKELLGVCIEC